LGEEVEQGRVGPTCHHAFGGVSDLGGRSPAWLIERHVPHHRQVLGRVSDPDPALVLAEGHA